MKVWYVASSHVSLSLSLAVELVPSEVIVAVGYTGCFEYGSWYINISF